MRNVAPDARSRVRNVSRASMVPRRNRQRDRVMNRATPFSAGGAPN